MYVFKLKFVPIKHKFKMIKTRYVLGMFVFKLVQIKRKIGKNNSDKQGMSLKWIAKKFVFINF